MKRVAVFGIAGFSGRHFEEYVALAKLSSSFEFFGFARDSSRARHSGDFVYCEGDALNKDEVDKFISEVRPSYILNLVGVFRAASFDELLAVNMGVSLNICEAVLRLACPVEKIVFVGSAAEYGVVAANPVIETAPLQPVSQYGLSKVYQTLLAKYFFQNKRVPTVVARTFNILGTGQSPLLSIGSFERQIEEIQSRGTIKVGNIATKRDFLPISEISRRYWAILMKGQPGEVYNVCSGVPRTIKSVLDALIRQSGKEILVETDASLFKEGDIESIYGSSAKYDEVDV